MKSLKNATFRQKSSGRKDIPIDKLQEERLKYLTDEKRIKAVTVMFSDLEGRLHMLDYDKKFLVKSHDNLTFDGSSIRGFTAQKESDLRLQHGLELVLLGTGGFLRRRQGSGIRRSDRQAGRPVYRRHARRAEVVCAEPV